MRLPEIPLSFSWVRSSIHSSAKKGLSNFIQKACNTMRCNFALAIATSEPDLDRLEIDRGRMHGIKGENLRPASS